MLRTGLAAAGLLLAANVFAADCAVVMARVVSAQGTVELRRVQSMQWSAAALEAELCPGDSLRVGERSRAALRLANDSNLRLDQLTTLTLGAAPERASLIELLRGAINVMTRTPKPFDVRTPFLNAGVEGTEFLVRVDADAAQVAVFEGKVSVANNRGAITLASGEVAFAAGDAPLRRERIVRPAQAVQWALYYPSIIGPGDTEEAPLREADALVRGGRISDAFARLDAVPTEARSARHAAYRAELLLLVGRVDDARTEVARALTLDARSSDAYALQSIIAVVQNEGAEALRLARRAVELDPRAATAHIALSYAEQARFDIAAALANAERAAALAPDGALAWARVAELRMASGDLGSALAAAQRATSLEPGLSRTQTVLGFAYLTRIETAAARQAFGRAIGLDASDPLPHLGLGLARIREGELSDGREEIEIAASLDPLNSLVRSYLGKAYFDEHRDPQAQNQYELAKQHDPNDPTPWFYDAVRSQASNQPGAALQSIQTSIEKNANRAVFRSRLLLDDDLAARSVNQASIYRQLGFDQLAIYEGYRALAADPVNYSAHRFLAEAYTDRPRHEFARENEALQAQMLQPISLNPLQLPLTATEAGAFGTTILFDPGFSEYDRLFVRDGIRFQAFGLAGTRGTRADQLLLSGVAGGLSYSLGQFHYETDGFRTNAQARKDLHDALVQYSPTERSSLHLEWRRVSTNQGDRVLRFDPDYVTDFRVGQSKELARLGGRHQLGDGTTLLVSLGRQSSRDTTDSESFGGRLFTSDRADRLVEMQIAHRSGRFHARAGVGYLSGRETTDFFGTQDQHDQKSNNAYLYASWAELPGGIRLEGGVSRDQVKDPLLAQQFKQTNYKVGLGWDVTATTTLRVASFRVLKRTGLAELTIEPTQVLGFNQFYEDFNGTSARRTAFALDHKFSYRAFAGLELTRRDLRVPQAFVDPIAIFDWHERSHTAYASFLPQQWLAINVAYRYEAFERVPAFNGLDDFIRVRTQQLPVTVSLTTSERTSVRLRLTPIRQGGTFLRSDLTPFDGRSTFAVADAMATFHLPKRYGIFTVGLQNLFDKRAAFQETDVSAPTITPQRFVFARLSLAF